MVAADIGFDYLCSADGTWSHELYGAVLEVKSEKRKVKSERNLSLNLSGRFLVIDCIQTAQAQNGFLYVMHNKN